jgi:DNA-binding PadR family transcriptional regulator
VVLALACEEPMHPYRMQTLIKQRGKDQIANVAQRNSVYQTIDALRRAGLIRIRGTSREDRRPERTTYEATEEGRRALGSWVRAGLSTPAREFPEFPAALSTLYGLEGPDDLRTLLETRIGSLETRLVGLEKPVPGIPRLFLLEGEYMAAAVRAEIKWLRGVVADLRSGRLRYPSEEELRRIAPEQGGPSEEAARRIAAEMHGLAQPDKALRPEGARSAPVARGASGASPGDKRSRAKRVTTPSRRQRGKKRRSP